MCPPELYADTSSSQIGPAHSDLCSDPWSPCSDPQWGSSAAEDSPSHLSASANFRVQQKSFLSSCLQWTLWCWAGLIFSVCRTSCSGCRVSAAVGGAHVSSSACFNRFLQTIMFKSVTPTSSWPPWLFSSRAHARARLWSCSSSCWFLVNIQSGHQHQHPRPGLQVLRCHIHSPSTPAERRGHRTSIGCLVSHDCPRDDPAPLPPSSHFKAPLLAAV